MVNKKIKIDYPYEVKTFIDEYLKKQALYLLAMYLFIMVL